jgi:hypothetical protein
MIKVQRKKRLFSFWERGDLEVFIVQVAYELAFET